MKHTEKQIHKEQQKLIKVYGCYAWCPNCGWPSNQITGKKRDDPNPESTAEQSETVCPKCGEKWWSFL